MARLLFPASKQLNDAMLAKTIETAMKPFTDAIQSSGNRSLTTGERQDLAKQLHAQLRRWQGDGSFVGAKSYVAALRAAADLGAPEVGEEVHKDLLRAGYHPRPGHFESLAQAYAKSGDIEGVYYVLSRLKRMAVSPGPKLYRTTISAFADLGKEEQALAVFNGMLKEGVEMDSTTCALALGACQSLDSARGVMQTVAGLNLVPDVRFYNMYLNVCLKLAVKTMKPAERSKDHYIACLADAEKVVADARLFADKMVEKNIVTYNLIMKAHGVIGDIPSVLLYYKLLKKDRDLAATTETFGTIIRCVAEKVRYTEQGGDKELRVAEAAHRQALVVTPSGARSRLHLKLAELYAALGLPDKLRTLLKSIQSEHVRIRGNRLHPAFLKYLAQAQTKRSRQQKQEQAQRSPPLASDQRREAARRNPPHEPSTPERSAGPARGAGPRANAGAA
ncbi:Pentatricopeptide repeat-containing protein [Diplonema papillatum]|nr:Pentatricopeptide repeat-containing protein [Diplonema papillatum]